MKKNNGIHFYINLRNLDDVIENEELRTGEIKHSVLALDTFFSSVELYGKKHYSKELVIEKITGSRLHMYVVSDDIVRCFEVVSAVAQYSQKLVYYMSQNISKYKTLIRFQLQVGACHGNFYEFTFNEGKPDAELTTIGYACNYAAKLQAVSAIGHIAISESIYDNLTGDQKKAFERIDSDLVKKYEQDYYYDAKISDLVSRFCFEKDLEKAREIASRVNLQDVNFRGAIKAVSFETLSKTEGKKIQGIPFFADVRGFTSQFDSDDANLEEMAVKTQNILTSMHQVILERKGIHVQFQGDREMALFHDYGEYRCASDAVIAGLKIIDKVKEFSVSVGVGQASGRLFAAKIGARNSRDNILLGRTVNQADENEDKHAGKNQVVISKDIYEAIKADRPLLASLFSKKADDLYYTESGYKSFLQNRQKSTLDTNNRQRNYNGAWSYCEWK